MRVATFLIVIAFALFDSVLAYSSGAGSCSAGNNAVGSTHKTGKITTGSLAKGGFTVKLGWSSSFHVDYPYIFCEYSNYFDSFWTIVQRVPLETW